MTLSSLIKIQRETRANHQQQPTGMIEPMRMQYIIKRLYARFLAGSIVSRVR